MLKGVIVWKLFYLITFFIGIVLMIFEINIYHNTIIHAYIPGSVVVITGLATFYFNRGHYKRTYSVKSNFFPLMQNFISWRFISCFIFMAINYYAASKPEAEYQFEIKDKYSLRGPKRHRHERRPVVVINYFNIEKKMFFHFNDTETVDNADSLILHVKKGGLGFDVIESYELTH